MLCSFQCNIYLRPHQPVTIKHHKCLPGENQCLCFCYMPQIEMTEEIQDAHGPQPFTSITEEGGRGGDAWGHPTGTQSIASTGSSVSWQGATDELCPHNLYVEALTPDVMLFERS